MPSRWAAFRIFWSNDETVELVCFAVARQYASGRLIGCHWGRRAASTPIASFGWCTVTPRAVIASRAVASFDVRGGSDQHLGQVYGTDRASVLVIAPFGEQLPCTRMVRVAAVKRPDQHIRVEEQPHRGSSSASSRSRYPAA